MVGCVPAIYSLWSNCIVKLPLHSRIKSALSSFSTTRSGKHARKIFVRSASHANRIHDANPVYRLNTLYLVMGTELKSLWPAWQGSLKWDEEVSANNFQVKVIHHQMPRNLEQFTPLITTGAQVRSWAMVRHRDKRMEGNSIMEFVLKAHCEGWERRVLWNVSLYVQYRHKILDLFANLCIYVDSRLLASELESMNLR